MSQDNVRRAIKWMHNPNSYKGGLPYSGGHPSSVKGCSSYTTITASEFPDGFVVWNPKRGYNAIDLCARSDAAAYDNNGLLGGAMDIRGTRVNLIPWSQSPSRVQVEPALESTYAIGRVAAGMLTVYSSTISVTSGALSGTLATAAISDITSLTSFSSSDLQQNAISNKDSAVGVPAETGITMFVGPDFSYNFRASSFYNSVRQNESSSTRVSLPLTGLRGVFFGNGYRYEAQAGQNVQNVALPPTPYWLKHDYELTVVPAVENASKILVNYHFYAAVTDPRFPNTTLDVAIEQETILLPAVGSHKVRFTPQIFKGRAYMGSYFAFEEVNTTAGGSMYGSITAENMYDEANIGAVRVGSWQGIGVGQNIVIRSELAFEGVATGEIAAYVKSSSPGVGRDSVSIDDFSFEAIKAQFNDPSNLEAVRVMARPRATLLSQPEKVHVLADSISSASGFYKNLGSEVGGIIGTGADFIADNFFASGTYAPQKKRRLA